jgi:hypothetical protein
MGEERLQRVAGAVWGWREDADRARRERAREAARARRTGAIQGAVGYGVGAAFWTFDRPRMALVVAAVASLALLLALVSPLGGHRRLSRWVARLAWAIGFVLTWVLMPLLFLLVFLPLGLWLRRRGRLRLTLGFEPSRATYWRDGGSWPRGEDAYRRQF